MQVKKDDLIFIQGQKGDHAYIIEEGQVEIFHKLKNDQESHLAILGQGELFGEMALIDANIRSASARALSDCRLLVIEKNQLIEKVDASDSVVQLMMRILLRRLRQQNQSHTGINLEENVAQQHGLSAVDKLRFESQINAAFQNREFQIYHQPIHDLAHNKLIGSEALIRWESPSQGLISPGYFVDVLENSSMIIPVGYWIFEECFMHYKQIREKAPANFTVSINVSGRQFAHHDFLPTLKALLIKHGVKAENFKLEITERILMEGGAIIDVLNQCRDIGFEISLDDFGTGFSSLQYLAQMPINYIKIDRSFVMNVLKDERTRAIIRSIVFLASQLNVKVISEGIESEAEASVMYGLGSDYGQGYLYSKPIPLPQFLKDLEGQKRSPASF